MEIPPGDTLLLPNMTFLVMGGIFAKDLDSVVLQVFKQFSFVLCHFFWKHLWVSHFIETQAIHFYTYFLIKIMAWPTSRIALTDLHVRLTLDLGHNQDPDLDLKVLTLTLTSKFWPRPNIWHSYCCHSDSIGRLTLIIYLWQSFHLTNIFL